MCLADLFNGNYIPNAISNYDSGRNGSRFNDAYASLMQSRSAGLANHDGSLQKWLVIQDAAEAIWALLDCYGMNARGSKLVRSGQLHTTFQFLVTVVDMDEIARFRVPTDGLNQVLSSGNTLAVNLGTLFEHLRLPNRVTASGRFVGASKALHCILPELVPMLDCTHTALSLYEIHRPDYLTPTGSWHQYLGFAARIHPTHHHAVTERRIGDLVSCCALSDSRNVFMRNGRCETADRDWRRS